MRARKMVLGGSVVAILLASLFVLAYGHLLTVNITSPPWNNISGSIMYDTHPYWNSEAGQYTAEWDVTVNAGTESLIYENYVPPLMKINNIFSHGLFPRVPLLEPILLPSSVSVTGSMPPDIRKTDLPGNEERIYDTNSGPNNRGDGYASIHWLWKWNNQPNFDTQGIKLDHTSQMIQGSPTINDPYKIFNFCKSDPCPQP